MLLSTFAFKFNLRRYTKVGQPPKYAWDHKAHGRGLHSYTSQLNFEPFLKQNTP